jgi:uncharacterized protein
MESTGNVGYSRPFEKAESPAKASHRGITPGRIVRFAAVVTGLIVACSWFVGATWAHFSAESDLALRMAFMLMALAFVPVTLIGRFWKHPLLRPLTLLSAVSVGALNFAMFAAAGTWIAVEICRLFGVPIESRSIVCALYGAAAIVTVYGLVNAARLRVTRVTIAMPNLPPDWEGRTAALVTDLHLGNIHGVAYVRHVVARITELEPDAVFIAGDLFDGASIDHAAAVTPLSKLVAPLGVYFVTGNHDEYAYRAAILTAVRGAGIHVLDNAKVDLEGLQIVGVHDADASDPRRLREILTRVHVKRETPSILLGHQPAHLAAAEEAGISLQLSGHTHAGQFWPWSALVSRIYGPFAYGLHHFRSLLVLTSSGVGTWGPPLRVGTRSEIVLITFEHRP